MSQQQQAQSMHDEAASNLTTIQAELSELRRKNDAGELSKEAFDTEYERVADHLDREMKLMAAAKDLATVEPPPNENVRNELKFRRPMAPESDDARVELADPQPEIEANPFREHMSVARPAESLQHIAQAAGLDHTDLFVLNKGGRQLLNRYLRSLNARVPGEHRLTEQEQLNINGYVDTDGGYITSSELRNEIIGQIRDFRTIRSKARVFPTQASEVSFPTFRVNVSLEQTRAHKANWTIDDNTTVSIRDILGRTTFTPHGSARIVKMPEEFLEDETFDATRFISEQIAEEAFDDEETAFLNGSGRNEPYGILTAQALAPDTFPNVEAGDGGSDITPNNIKLLPYELRAVMRANAGWMMPRATLKKVVVFREDSGAGADTGNYLFVPGIVAGQAPTLAGYELMESEFFPDYNTTGSQNDPLALFCDWRHYWIIDRLTLEIRMLMERYADEGQVGIRYRKRYDAAPVRFEAFGVLERGA